MKSESTYMKTKKMEKMGEKQFQKEPENVSPNSYNKCSSRNTINQ